MIWSGETKISIFGSGRIKYVRHCIGEELHPYCIQATAKNHASVMICECISPNSVGQLHAIDDILNSRMYIDIILQSKFQPFIRDLFPDNVPFFY